MGTRKKWWATAENSLILKIRIQIIKNYMNKSWGSFGKFLNSVNSDSDRWATKIRCPPYMASRFIG